MLDQAGRLEDIKRRFGKRGRATIAGFLAFAALLGGFLFAGGLVGDRAKGADPASISDWEAGIEQRIREREYQVSMQSKDAAGQPFPDGLDRYHFANRAQNLRSYIHPVTGSWHLQARTDEVGRSGDWTWDSTLIALGREDGNTADGPHFGDLTATDIAGDEGGRRLVLERDGLDEWYRNSETGIEQGFDVPRRAAGDGRLALTFDLTTDLAVDPTSSHEIIFKAGASEAFRLQHLVATDADGRALTAEMRLAESDGGRYRLAYLVDDSRATYPIVIDPLASTPDWIEEIDQADAYFGASVASAGDVNNDGYDDVIVGAWGYDGGQPDEGAAFAYYGSAGGLSASPDWTDESDSAGAMFGFSVASVAPYQGTNTVDGDGYADVIIGAPGYSNVQAEEGAAFVYLGGASGLAVTPYWTEEGDQVGARFGTSVAAAFALDGGIYADVIIGAPLYNDTEIDEGAAFVYYGSSSGLSVSADWSYFSGQAGALLGTSVASAGNVYDDIFVEVVVGAPLYDDDEVDEGAAFVFYSSSTGPSASPDWIAQSDQAGAYFGFSVAGAGNVNGGSGYDDDDYDDVIIGAPYYDDGESDEGAAFVYHGSVDGLSEGVAAVTAGDADWSAQSDQAGARFGFSVSSAGDVNGDDFADVIIGAPDYDDGEADEGAAFVYHGYITGLFMSDADYASAGDADWAAGGDQAGASFGASVASAGDVNGDDFGDVIVGALTYDNDQTDEGRAYVFYGDQEVLAPEADWSTGIGDSSAGFGVNVSTAGDVNGDGFSDVAVGAVFYDDGVEDEGAVFIYYGSPTGPSDSPDWSVTGGQNGSYFGWSVATAGDVNGDGYSDVIVGAPIYDDGETDQGVVFVYHGSSAGPSAIPDWFSAGGQTTVGLSGFGSWVATAGDVNGDGYSDVIVGMPGYNGGTDGGAAFVYHGSSSGLSPEEDWFALGEQAESGFGIGVATAGDVNGDGYSDVIVGAAGYSGDEVAEGRAYVYHGSADGLSITSDWIADGYQAPGGEFGGLFGYSVSTAGDVNGDGYSDVIVGAVSADIDFDLDDQGAAWVYHGSADGLSVVPDWVGYVDPDFVSVSGGYGWRVATAGDVNGDGFSDVLVGALAYSDRHVTEGAVFVYHGSADGLSSGAGQATTADEADFYVQSNVAGGVLGYAASTAGDVNGDGYADIIIGTPSFTAPDEQGAAYVYYGASAGLGTTDADPSGFGVGFDLPDGILEAAFLDSRTAGDVNGDGYADLIVSVPFSSDGVDLISAVYVYHGGDGDADPDWVLYADVDDADGDTYAVAQSAASAGDVNGDGYSDIIIPAFGEVESEPFFGAFFFAGSPDGLAGTGSAPIVADWDDAAGVEDFPDAGTAIIVVGSAGDVNGDGYSDVIIGLPLYENGEPGEGAALVYHGSAEGPSEDPDWFVESDEVEAIFGWMAATAGDVNGDGYSDVVVGALGHDGAETDQGAASVYHGSRSGLSDEPDAVFDLTDVGPLADAVLGAVAATAGDVNGDGYSDLLLTAPGYITDIDGDSGIALLYHGSEDGLSSAYDWIAEADAEDVVFGFAAATAGDVNGDGYSDVFISGQYDGEDKFATSGTLRIHAYRGSAAGLVADPEVILTTAFGAGEFSPRLAAAGDVNGDSYGDLVLMSFGFPDPTDPGLEIPAFVVFLGNVGYGTNPAGGLAIAPRQLKNEESPLQLLNDSGTNHYKVQARAATPAGRTQARLVIESKPLGEPFDGSSLVKGAFADTALDYVDLARTINEGSSGMYHWRARFQYMPHMNYGPWFSIGPNGWNEADLRLASASPVAASCPSSAIDLSSPMGGESYAYGTSQTIFFSAQGCQLSGLNVLLSTDGGSSYGTTISEDAEYQGGSYAWTVPDISSTMARIRLELIELGGSIGAFDESGNFTIVGSVTPASEEPTPPVAETPTPTEPAPAEEEEPIMSEEPTPPPAATPAVPAVPATPAVPGERGEPAVPAGSATPAQPTSVSLTPDSFRYFLTAGRVPLRLTGGNVLRVATGMAFTVYLPDESIVKPIRSAGITLGGETTAMRETASYEADLVAPSESGDHELVIRVDYEDATADVVHLTVQAGSYGTVYELVNGEPRPVAGARVTLLHDPGTGTFVPWDAGSRPNPAVTGADGTYFFVVPPGNYELRIEKPGYLTSAIEPFAVGTENYVSRSAELVPAPTVVAPPELPLDDQRVEAGSRSAAAALTALALLNVATLAGVLPFLLYLWTLLTHPVQLIARRRRAQWGVVYNAFTKLPVDLAIVRLLDATTGRLVRSAATDKAGRYVFIVGPGNYRLSAAKAGFVFPSQALGGQPRDARYLDLYHGEMISVTESLMIRANIPIEPLGEVKTPARIRAEKLGRRLQTGVSIAVILGVAAAAAISPSAAMFGLLAANVILYLIFRRIAVPPRPKNWGTVSDQRTGRPLRNAIARIFETRFNRLLETQVTDASGHYAFLVGENAYYVTFEKPGYQKERTADLDLTVGQKTGAQEVAVDVRLAPTADHPE